MPEINRSTVYRNLDELQRMGAIDRTYYGQCATYHLAARAHSHLVCEHCGSITEIPDTTFAGLATAIRDQYGFARWLRTDCSTSSASALADGLGGPYGDRS